MSRSELRERKDYGLELRIGLIKKSGQPKDKLFSISRSKLTLDGRIFVEILQIVSNYVKTNG